MKFYLSSSYWVGDSVVKIRKIAPKNKKTGLILNALDHTSVDEEKVEQKIKTLKLEGLQPEILDLKMYFGKQKELEKRLSKLGVVWVNGGNVFVLRQAMRLSGFDKIFNTLLKRKDFLYGGYSAGICVLAKDMHGLEVMDDPTQRPYGKKYKVIWEGLGFLDYMILPHYKSEHPESKLATKAVQYFIDHKLLFKALKDGEVIIID
ncbi:MAG: peptidase E [Candidatus Parvarchaeota archaeon]|nr:peptidase E [Candidatus Parvarchaeota archaeon]